VVKKLPELILFIERSARGDFRQIAPRKKQLKSQTGNPVQLPTKGSRKGPRVVFKREVFCFLSAPLAALIYSGLQMRVREDNRRSFPTQCGRNLR
jgi:hypothetical protein